MQVTITLNHLLIIIICIFFLAIILYGLQICKNISKELSIIAARISHYQGRLANIEEQMASVAVDVQDMKAEVTGKRIVGTKRSGTPRCGNLSGYLAELKKILTR